jgi:putative methyltransferase
LKWAFDEAIKTFQKSGYSLGDPLDGMYVPLLSLSIEVFFYRRKLAPPPLLRNFARDAHIENLLLFPPQSKLTDIPEYSDGRLILQDKASCFPAVVLAPPAHPESVIIDATAAPGNKTSHLSALMGNQGKVQAPHPLCRR